MTRLSLFAIMVIGCLIFVPTTRLDFYVDDYIHRFVLRGDQPDAPMKPWALYDFGTVDDWRTLDGTVGTFPWWTSDDWRVRFWRPLASVALWGQYELFGDHAVGYHVTSLLLFALLLALVFRLYRSLGLSEWSARAGTLVVACSDAGVLPVGWTANQSSLLVAVFAVFSFRTLFVATRASGIVLGVAAAVLAALSKESGSVALMLATALLVVRSISTADVTRRRLFNAGAFVSVTLLALYFVFLGVNGYGAASLFYAAPWTDPGRFAGNLMLLATAGTVSLAGPFPLDVITVFPAARLGMFVIGAAIALPLLVWMARTLRNTDRTTAGWLVLWVVSYLGVQAGAPPSDRLLFVPTVGAAALLALFVEARRKAVEAGDSRPLPRIMTTALFLAATVASGGYALMQCVGISIGSAHLREKALVTDVGSPELGHRELFVLQSETQMQAFSLHSTWAYGSPDHALSFRILQAGNRALRWKRIDDVTFEVTSLSDPFLGRTFESVYLSQEPAFAPGDRWQSGAFDVEALEVENGLPTKLSFRMKRSLDDENLRFLRAVDGRLTRIAPPAIGEEIVLEEPELSGPFMP